jgi:predicted SprT family Zn-dependent metalloprotease
MFVELNNKHFNGEIPEIPVIWNTRMTTTAGYCRYRKEQYNLSLNGQYSRFSKTPSLEPFQIDLSDRLFRNEGYAIAKIERTLIHEMVHAFLVHKYNEKGHTARFHRMMTEITGEDKNHRCHNYNVEGLRKKSRYFLVCKRCGSEHGMTRKPKHPTYKHRGCGGTMTLATLSTPDASVNIF